MTTPVCLPTEITSPTWKGLSAWSEMPENAVQADVLNRLLHDLESRR